ncbi:MAG: flap endonuclease-1 [Candidatus Woesearchaeota archaeon]|nr:MAG: flap endonuclease-1 [Candidatus Woesearchaeota archaeon]
MGVDLGSLVVAHDIELGSLKTKKLAIDAYNTLYQFLSIIRQRDGTPLMDSKGRVTSHLSGLFHRTINLLELGIKPCFVFDGQAPELKADVQEQRRAIKEKATEEHKKALEKGDVEEARKWAQQTSRLTKEMVSESKKLIVAMGLPYVQAIGEGEAQAAWMVKEGMVHAVVSQDYDSLLFGAPLLIRNLSVSGKRKLPGKQAYVEVKPQKISLVETLNNLKIVKEQLIKLAILLGTDYNKGVKGIGPKKALEIVKDLQFAKYTNEIKHWKRVEQMFLEPPIAKDFDLVWTEPKKNDIFHILCNEHDFSKTRVENALKKLSEAKGERSQEGLDEFF